MKTLMILTIGYPLLSMVLLASAAYGQSLFHDLPWSPPIWTVSCPSCIQPMHLKTITTLTQAKLVTNIDWSPDGKYIAIESSQESQIDVYDTADWKPLRSVQVMSSPWGRGVKFLSTSDDLIIPPLASGSALETTPGADYNVSAEEWNFKNNLIVRKFRISFVEDDRSREFSKEFFQNELASYSLAQAIAVSSDGRYIATSVATGAIIYDSSDAQVVQNIKCEIHFSYPNNPFTIRYDSPYAIALSPDGHKITLVDCHINKISTYDVISGSLVYETNISRGGGGFDAIAYNSDGSLIAIGLSDDEFAQLTILRASDGTIIGSSPGENTFPESLQWVPGRDLVLMSYQALYGTNWDTGASLEGTDKSDPRIWDAKTLSLVDQFRGWQLEAAAFSPDGTKLAISSVNKVIIESVK